LPIKDFEFQRSQQIKAAVIFPDIYGVHLSLSPQARLDEACGLARAINLDIVHHDIIKVKMPKAGTLIGQGVIDDLSRIIANQDIELVIFDTSLSPIQQRNLEEKLNVKVIDRTALILEIFGERAQTKEGKLQVELAHLTYQRSRLVRSWTHLERQRGGGGFLGGPGEKQIELDRRLIDNKIIALKKDLEKVKLTRSIQRQSRSRVPYPIVALVGYTNAGKSTLYNLLSSSSVLAQDMLFATLDTSMSKIKLPSGSEIILSDTVGFISDLPHELIMAFRATLEEVLQADLLIHVRDAAFENSSQQKQDVLKVLSDIGLDNITDSEKYLEVLNKIDLLSAERKNNLLNRLAPNQTALSALSGEGKELLLRKIDTVLQRHHQIISLTIPAADGKNLAWIHRTAEVLSQQNIGESLKLTIRASAENIAKLRYRLSINQ